MIEVKLHPGVPGCVTVPLGCLSLGLVPLITWWGESNFAQRMDDLGVQTRGGKRVAWAEVTKIVAVRGQVKNRMGTQVGPSAYEYWLESRRGRVRVPLWRTTNANAVRAFVFAHLAPDLLEQVDPAADQFIQDRLQGQG